MGYPDSTKMVEQANSYEYATFHNMMRQNSHDEKGNPLSPQFSDVVVQKFKDGSDPIRFPSTLWAGIHHEGCYHAE